MTAERTTVRKAQGCASAQDTFEQVHAGWLQNRCLLITTFEAGEAPDNYLDVAMNGWNDVIDAFGESAGIKVLCLGDRPHQASVWIAGEDGQFRATPPGYSPYWDINDAGELCLGESDDPGFGSIDNRDCVGVHINDEYVVRLGSDGPMVLAMNNDDGTAIYGGIIAELQGQ